jgi:hypothetical protein
LCLAVLLLTACSAESERQNRADSAAGQKGAGEIAPGGRHSSGAGSSDHVEYTVEGVLLRREEAVLNVEEARLQRTGRSGFLEVVVRTAVRAPANYENCLLMRESTWRGLERSFAEDDLPDKQVIEHPWGRRTVREEFAVGDEMVVVFSESQDQAAEATDAGEVPLYALCYTQVVASGVDGRRTTWFDVSRVGGTPEPSRER